MIQQGQVFKLRTKDADGQPLRAYRYRLEGPKPEIAPEESYARFLAFTYNDFSLWKVAWDEEGVAGQVRSFIDRRVPMIAVPEIAGREPGTRWVRPFLCRS